MPRDDDAYFNAEQSLDDALAQLATTRARATESMESMKAARTTVQAKDRSLSIIFSGAGDVVDMTFHGTKYRTAAPAELAHSILDTLKRGRLQCLEAMAESMGDSPLGGMDFVGIATGKVDPAKAIDSMLAPMLQRFPGSGPDQGRVLRG